MKKIFSLFAALLFVGSMWGAVYFEDTFSNVGTASSGNILPRTGWSGSGTTAPQGNSGVRVGASSSSATITKTAMTNIEGTVTLKVTVYTCRYNTNANKFTVTAENGTIASVSGVGTLSDGTLTIAPSANAGVTSTTSAANWTDSYKTVFTITGASSSTTISFASDKRTILGPVKIENAPAESAVTIGSHVGGSLEVTGATDLTKVEEGTVLTVTATPDAENHYIGGSVKVIKTGITPEADVTSTVYNSSTGKLTMPAYAVTVSATFTPTYKINLVAEGGSIALDYTAGGAEEGYAKEGTEITATATADGTHTFKSLTVSEIATEQVVVDNEAVFIMPAAAVTVTATFDELQDPAINIDESALAFGEVDINSEAEALKQTFTISGINIKSDLTLTITGDGKDAFSAACTAGSLTPNEDEEVAATVTVTPRTTVAGEYSATLTVAGGGLAEKDQKAIALTLTVNKLAAGISWAEASKVGVLGEAYTHPTLNNPNSLMVSLSSTNKSVADFEEGQIVLKAAGTTTIKATSVETSVYAQGEVSYTLTVKEKYTITWHVNGATSTTEEVEGDIITPIADPVLSSDYEEKVFQGWLTTELATTDEAPAFVDFSALAASEDADYYAVFATYVASTEKILLSEEFDNELTSDATQAITSTDIANFSGATSKAYKGAYGTLKFGTSSYTGYITTKDLDLSEPFTVSLKVKKYNTDDADIAITVDDEDAVTIAAVKDITSNFKVFSKKFDAATEASAIKIGTSGGNRAYIDSVVVKTGEPESYSAYCTTVPEKTYAVTFTASYEHGTLVVKNGETSINSSDAFVKGTVLTVEATPVDANYALTALTAGGDNILAAKQFVVGTSDIAVEATFAEKEAAPISWSAATATAYTVGKSYTLPTLTNELGLAVIYSSETPATATISNEEGHEGEISIVAAGSTVIKATYTATAEGAYKTTEVSYTLTVYAPASVVVTGDATKKAYEAGETFSFEGLGAKATYADEAEYEIPAEEITWAPAEAPAINEDATIKVTATWQGLTSAIKNVNVTVNTHQVTIDSNYEHGTVKVTLDAEGEGADCADEYFEKGTTLYVIATPEEGYKVESIKIAENASERTLEGNSFEIGTSDVTVIVSFSEDGGGTAVDNTEVGEKVVKSMENGVLIIRRGDKTYNGQGQLVK